MAAIRKPDFRDDIAAAYCDELREKLALSSIVRTDIRDGPFINITQYPDREDDFRMFSVWFLDGAGATELFRPRRNSKNFTITKKSKIRRWDDLNNPKLFTEIEAYLKELGVRFKQKRPRAPRSSR